MSSHTKRQLTVYLASRSPRRAELLQQLGYCFQTLSVDIDESQRSDELPADFVARLAAEKARAGHTMLVDVAHADASVILAADTVVVCDDIILGKPVDEADAAQMLARLSGRTHQVYTGVSLIYPDPVVLPPANRDLPGVVTHNPAVLTDYSALLTHNVVNKTEVSFRTISPTEVKWYWDTGEPADKAGGYGIQGLGAIFVQRIEGSYTGVMGLPLFETSQLLQIAGIRPVG